MIPVEYINGGDDRHTGLIPDFLFESDDRSAAEQIASRYAYGGGWSPLRGWALREDDSIKYPGDPALKPRAQMLLRDETILIYDHAWVAIVQPDRSFEVSRLD